MKRTLFRLLGLLVVLVVLVAAFLGVPVETAFAQQIDVQTTIDATEIELGDSVTYQIQVTSPSDAPSDPKLPSPQGFTIVDHGNAPSHMVSIINGRKSEKIGLTSTWVLRGDRLGTFSIGPATVTVGGIRKQGQIAKVSIVAPGMGKPKPKPKGPKPFDPFGGGGGGGGAFDPFKGIFPGVDDDQTNDIAPLINADPKLGLDAPRAPVAFLHATVDKTRAVVGEQVTLHVFLYEDLHSRQGRPSDVHEATATDFVKRSLLQDETRATHAGNAMVGGKPWAVKLVRKNALFPIKPGRLAIAPMSLTLPQARVGLRESETLYVDVTEPPVNGRPPGYQLGDTGDFSMSASVTPKSTDQHGAIGVTVEIRGTGNMPATLPTPEVQGVEWLEPQTRDSLGPASGPQSNDRFGGTRTFSYVVRLHKDGAIDLGEIRLPYWDPGARAYNVARAAIGIIQVAKSSGRDAGPDVAEPLLPNMPKARASMEGKHTETFLTERPVYWGALFGSPLACALAIAGVGAVKRAREKRAATAPSPEKIAREKRSEAESALKGKDGKAAMAAVVRAVEAEVLARTGVNPKGTSREGVVRELADAGVAEESAKRVTEILAACEDARYSPNDVPVDDAKALWKRARAALSEMGGSADQ
jgi:hypothetical protein